MLGEGCVRGVRRVLQVHKSIQGVSCVPPHTHKEKRSLQGVPWRASDTWGARNARGENGIHVSMAGAGRRGGVKGELPSGARSAVSLGPDQSGRRSARKKKERERNKEKNSRKMVQKRIISRATPLRGAGGLSLSGQSCAFSLQSSFGHFLQNETLLFGRTLDLLPQRGPPPRRTDRAAVGWRSQI